MINRLMLALFQMFKPVHVRCFVKDCEAEQFLKAKFRGSCDDGEGEEERYCPLFP